MAMTVTELFDNRIPQGLSRFPERVKEFSMILQFNVTGGSESGSWTVDTVNTPPSCKPGAREDAQCVVNIPEANLLELVNSPASQRAPLVMRYILEGVIDMEGEMQQVLKLGKVFAMADGVD